MGGKYVTFDFAFSFAFHRVLPQSLATGRLATFYLPFVDCELPNDPEPTIDDDGSLLPSCE